MLLRSICTAGIRCPGASLWSVVRSPREPVESVASAPPLCRAETTLRTRGSSGLKARLWPETSRPRTRAEAACTSYHASHAYAEIGKPGKALPHLRFYVQNADASTDQDEADKVLESRGSASRAVPVRCVARHRGRASHADLRLACPYGSQVRLTDTAEPARRPATRC